MTKRDKILKIFNDAQWVDLGGRARVKTIDYDDFYNAGLRPQIEFSERYNDVIYARRIIQAMGHRVLIGNCFHIYENVSKSKPKTIFNHGK